MNTSAAAASIQRDINAVETTVWRINQEIKTKRVAFIFNPYSPERAAAARAIKSLKIQKRILGFQIEQLQTLR